MRIACPDCSATYDVPDSMLGAKREVRCAKCGHQWVPVETASGEMPAREIPAREIPAGKPAPAPLPAANAAAEPPPVRAPLRGPTPVPLPPAWEDAAPSPPRPHAAEKLAGMFSPESEQPLPPEPAARFPPARADRVEPPPQRPRAPAAVWLGWVASVAVWALVVWAAYAYRAQVMDAWPPSQRLYAALGLGPGS